MSVNSWDDTTVGSVARMNKTGVISGTGAYLAGLDKTKHKLLHCTSTGSGFTLDHVYLCSTDGTSVIDISTIAPHNHTKASGSGSFMTILDNNSDVIDSGSEFMFGIDTDRWTSVVSGTGASTAVTNYTNGTAYTDESVLKMSTGATSGSTANWRIAGIPVDYSEDSHFQTLVAISSTTSVNARAGFNLENTSATDDNGRKYGFNLCTSVNGNWFARSANGTTRSDSDMGIAFNTSPTNLTAVLDRDANEINYYVNFANLLTKTTDVPGTSSGARDNLFRFSVKNNTAADRLMHGIKLRVSYYTSTEWW